MIDMSITYPADIEATINKLVENGRYSDPVDVVREAVRLLEERESQRDSLRAKLQIGLDQIERGEVIEVTPEFWEELDRDVDEALRRGDIPDPDICP